MANNHLRVTSYNNPLGKIPLYNANSYGFMERDLLEWLAGSLNFTYELITPREVQMGFRLANGSWTGVLGLLQRGEVDLSASFGLATHSKSYVVDQTFPIIADNMAIMIPYPELDKGVFSLSLTSSAGILAIVLLMILVGYFLWFVYRFQKEGKLQKGELTMFLVGITLSQGGYVQPNSFPFRCALAAWVVGLFFMVNIFSSVLTSIILTPQYNFLLRSPEELVGNEIIKPIVFRGSTSHADLVESPGKLQKAIVAKMAQNSKSTIEIAPKYKQIVDVVLEYPNQALIVSDIIQGFDINQDLKRNGVCRALTLSKFISTRNNCLMLRKNSPYTQQFNRQILLLLQNGMAGSLEKKYTSMLSRKCSMHELEANQGKPMPMTITQLFAIYFVLIIGWVTSILFFVAELIYFNCTQKS